jgi:hypothetical protein
MSANRRLKIIFFPYWYPNGKNSFAATFVREHAKAVSLFDDVTVIYNEGYDESLEAFWKIISDNIEDGIRIIRIKNKKFPVHFFSYLAYLWSFGGILKKIIRQEGKPDIIHAHIYSASVPAALWGRIYKIPVVVTEHSTEFLKGQIGFLKRLKIRIGMGWSKIILPVSQDLLEAIKSLGIRKEFEVIPNAVDGKIFYPGKILENGKKKILFVGD